MEKVINNKICSFDLFKQNQKYSVNGPERGRNEKNIEGLVQINQNLVIFFEGGTEEGLTRFLRWMGKLQF